MAYTVATIKFNIFGYFPMTAEFVITRIVKRIAGRFRRSATDAKKLLNQFL